jgi:hypothetical protein
MTWCLWAFILRVKVHSDSLPFISLQSGRAKIQMLLTPNGSERSRSWVVPRKYSSYFLPFARVELA